ncbi:MAG: hypothetical protein ACP5N1_05045 [Candidatus Woesearchaeota archaeon]
MTKERFEIGVVSGEYRVSGCIYGVRDTAGFEILPNEFLSYAEKDLLGNTDRDLVNALSNIKRALDCQINLILIEYGVYKQSKKDYWNFPKKIEFLTKHNIAAPRILKKINNIRNLLEHEFKKPTLEQAEDALDIVSLFISYTKKLGKIPTELMVYADEGRIIFNLNFDKENKKFIFLDSHKKELFCISELDKSFPILSKKAYDEVHGTFSF